MPTFESARLEASVRARAIERVVGEVVASADIEVDTLRDVRGRVEAALGWGAFAREDRKMVKRATLAALGVPAAAPPRAEN